ncbi:tryptophan synthase subunit alpha [Nakamurella antarctica]|uniref:Tryptophan synthase alpha chain n=1 Tax=Nakamurella antarctica TaxID=1902245 RepID=A0A3G8ZM72_9ACTN|nr:tryptophan synthase subunit alpha [Nakamurella antarctica]AZI57877.1 tryptophan synthase subunit alpha [Nakamurella antarctica]
MSAPASSLDPARDAAPARVSRLQEMFDATKAENRAALVGYLPAGYPNLSTSIDHFAALIDGGCDLVEVGLPFSDPVMDGGVIQAAAEASRRNGFRIADIFTIVESVARRGGRAVVMTYFNPVLAYGEQAFARDLAAAGGLGVITPDLIVDEAPQWLRACTEHQIDPIFLVAPSSPNERIALTAEAARGFLYAASTMGVTGARDTVSSAAPELVSRCRALTNMPIGVGLGVRTPDQAAEIGAFADAVIVGSAFTSAAEQGSAAVAVLASELAAGVRRSQRPTAS